MNIFNLVYLLMASPIRYFQKGSFYHVYNRGNRKQNIFIVKSDYARFLKRSKEYKDKFGITILCYCLMPNHFHFLLRQDSEIPITTFMLRLCTSYAKYFNIKYEEVGSLFQSPFKAKAVETEEYLLQLSRYIYQNPKKILPSTRGVELASYSWSSYPSCINEIKNDLVDPAFLLNYFAKNNPRDDYKNFIETDFRDKDIDLIKDLILEDF
ncbi:MAG: transposase [Patescibacteria group bacterium]|nr:transposase [Patescibacteria group bacterium]